MVKKKKKKLVMKIQSVIFYALLLFSLLQQQFQGSFAARGNCDEVKIGDLVVVDNPVRAKKALNTLVTTLRIVEEQYFGSLTCHILRSPNNTVLDHFSANSSTVFKKAGAYDPYVYGKKTHRIFTCDIYLRDTFFDEDAVDLEVALILQPLLDRNGLNPCDVPVIAKQTIRVEFTDKFGRPVVATERDRNKNNNNNNNGFTRYPNPFLNLTPNNGGRRRTTTTAAAATTVRPERRTTTRRTRRRKPQRPSKDRSNSNRNRNKNRNRNEDEEESNSNRNRNKNDESSNRNRNRNDDSNSNRRRNKDEEENKKKNGSDSNRRKGDKNEDENRNKNSNNGGKNSSDNDEEDTNRVNSGDDDDRRDSNRGKNKDRDNDNSNSSNGNKNSRKNENGSNGGSRNGSNGNRVTTTQRTTTERTRRTTTERPTRRTTPPTTERTTSRTTRRTTPTTTERTTRRTTTTRRRTRTTRTTPTTERTRSTRRTTTARRTTPTPSTTQRTTLTSTRRTTRARRTTMRRTTPTMSPSTTAATTRKTSTARPTRRTTRRISTERTTERSTRKTTKRPTRRTERPTRGTTERPTRRTTERPIRKTTKRPTRETTERPTRRTTERTRRTTTRRTTRARRTRPTTAARRTTRISPTAVATKKSTTPRTRTPNPVPFLPTSTAVFPRRNNSTTPRLPRIGPNFIASTTEGVLDNRLLVDTRALPPSDNGDKDSPVSLEPSTTQPSEVTIEPDVDLEYRNASLLYSIIAIAFFIFLVVCGILIYYCCPSVCGYCGECSRRAKQMKSASSLSDHHQLTTTFPNNFNQRHLRNGTVVNIDGAPNGFIKAYPHHEDDRDVVLYEGVEDHRRHRRPGHLDPLSQQSGYQDVGDNIVLVEERPRSSPITVRILRAITPRSFSVGDNRSHVRSFGRQISKGSRVFQIVKDHYGRRRSGTDRSDLEISTLDNQNLQVMKLDDDDDIGMYEKAGQAEILHLDDDDDDVFTGGGGGRDSSATFPDVRLNDNHLGLLNPEDQNRLRLPLESERSNAENKNIQTDLTYSKMNKKSQTTAAVFDMSDSDEDNDIANQSLSQSQAMGLKSFNGPGFLNTAIHELLYDKARRGELVHPHQQQQQQQQHQQFESESEFERSHRSLLSYPGRTQFSRHSNEQQQQQQQQQQHPGRESVVARRFSRRSKKSHNFYNGNRTPDEPSYSENKASMLRQRNMNAKQSANGSPMHSHRSTTQRQRLAQRISRSTSDLSKLMQLREVDTPATERRKSTPLNQ